MGSGVMGVVPREVGADKTLPIGLILIGKKATVVRVKMPMFASSERGGKDVASADKDVDSEKVVDVVIPGVPSNVG